MARKTTSGTSSSAPKTTGANPADEAQKASPEKPPETDADAASESTLESEDATVTEPEETDKGTEPSAEEITEPAEPEQAMAETGSDTPEAEDIDEIAADTPEDSGPQDESREHVQPTPDTTELMVVRKGGFVPLVLGGAVAGLIGFAAGHYVTPEIWGGGSSAVDSLRSETQQTLQEQSDRISALSDRIGTAEPPGLSELQQGQAELSDTIGTLASRVGGAEEQLAALEARLSEVEARPLSEGASDAAVAAYDAELKALQEAMAAQRAEIEEMTAQARDMEENAEATAQATMRRAALSRIQTALDAGGGYADALADLESAGLTVPDTLSRSADRGVATLAALQESFPDAARAALAAARDAAAEAGETGGLSAFLHTQLGARSLEPREGDDPDAVLSRAEAAMRESRLTDALAEIEALPESARAELSDWAGQAARRLEAIAAAQELSEELN